MKEREATQRLYFYWARKLLTQAVDDRENSQQPISCQDGAI
jgi:hypothetical protein